MKTLDKYGASPRFYAEAALYPEFQLGRVVSQYRDLFKVAGTEGEFLAEVSGKFRFEAKNFSEYPAVGDFVMLDRSNDNEGNAIIHRILMRKSSFERKAVGYVNQTQVVAANIDIVFICMSLNSDFNLSRLERYLSVAWDSNAKPVIILTKADVCDDVEQRLIEVSDIAIGVDVIVTSSLDEQSVNRLIPYLQQGVTASFIGSSGVGKSTLINCLAGTELFKTSETRKDDKGRHTSTARELIVLPQGGIVIDTPGMRELGVESVDLSKSFSDIDSLSELCRFRDCTHTNEPGCAIQQAINTGELDIRRFESFLKLKKEAKYDGLSFKEIETEKINSMFGGMSNMKNLRDYMKQKNKRR